MKLKVAFLLLLVLCPVVVGTSFSLALAENDSGGGGDKGGGGHGGGGTGGGGGERK
jgi:hypothetical protein